MPVAAYYRWERDGRPISPSQTIREMVSKMKLAYPEAADTFSWYADNAHYQAEFPQDHTPYSATGWPTESPYPYVFATDIMHRPDLGVNCFELFPYWLAQAKAGQTPWRKYIIWQARIYDVRNAWRSQPSSGHMTHIHLSDRTDWVNRSIGDWDPTGEDIVTPEQFLTIMNDPKVAALWKARTVQYPIYATESLLTMYKRWDEILKKQDGAPPGTGGGGISEDRVREIFREELDKTKLGPA